jgi:gamma-glutamyltranspeptidase/glutathione hydrolase
MQKNYSRREMLRLGAATVMATTFAPPISIWAKEKNVKPHGVVLGDTLGSELGEKILAEGGNAIDAAVAGVFGGMISSPSKCGPGGYGGSMMIGLANGKITCIDFNSTAPAAARPDMYPLDEKGNVKGRVNFHGWLAVGVPGTLAGMQLALERYGTKSLHEVLQPAISSAKSKPRSDKYFDFEQLIKLFSTLAERNSVETFYRGDIAQVIAAAFQKNGGLVTAKDLAAYHAREGAPYEMQWKGLSILTAPLCAGGLTALQALQILKALKWDESPPGLEAAHARLETLRLAWKDRWETFGDPDIVPVPIQKFLSDDYARECAAQVRAAVKAKQPLSLHIEHAEQLGTMNISAVDKQGNLVACTLTHGGGYGAQVAVESLGMVLGHGMARFDPRPGQPNSVAPGKRPQHNMSPSILVKNGRPVVAIGAGGGTKIQSSIYDFCSYYIGRGKSFVEAVDAPRLNTVGTMDLRIEKQWPRAEVNFFEKLGYKVIDYPGAFVSAVSFDPKTGAMNGREHRGNPFPVGDGK